MRTDTFQVGGVSVHLHELNGHGWLAQQYATGLVARGVEDNGQRFALLNVINLLCQTVQIDGLDVSPAYALTSLDALQAAAEVILAQPKALVETWSSRVYLLNQHNDAELQPPGDVPPLSAAPTT